RGHLLLLLALALNEPDEKSNAPLLQRLKKLRVRTLTKGLMILNLLGLISVRINISPGIDDCAPPTSSNCLSKEMIHIIGICCKTTANRDSARNFKKILRSKTLFYDQIIEIC